MKKPKITIVGHFPTGEEWNETANNKAEFEWCLNKIYSNVAACGYPEHIIIRGKTPKYVLKKFDFPFTMWNITNKDIY